MQAESLEGYRLKHYPSKKPSLMYISEEIPINDDDSYKGRAEYSIKALHRPNCRKLLKWSLNMQRSTFFNYMLSSFQNKQWLNLSILGWIAASVNPCSFELCIARSTRPMESKASACMPHQNLNKLIIRTTDF